VLKIVFFTFSVEIDRQRILTLSLSFSSRITKASCQAWLKLLFANEVRIGGPGGGRCKILRLLYPVAIG
jgi:hypothetical protein